MKTAKDPRHLQRVKVMQDLFASDFHRIVTPSTDLGKLIKKDLKKIDKLILKAAPAWPLEKINRIDLAILRLAIFELIISPQNPPKVIIDEAVELAKQYGGESSPSFINGVLGKLIIDNEISV